MSDNRRNSGAYGANHIDGYRAGGIQAKQRMVLERAREQPCRCPGCEAALDPADLLAHVEQRCAGPREVHPHARWLTWKEAYRLVPRATLRAWVRRKVVRVDGPPRARRYLLRDVVQALAVRRIARGRLK